MSPVRPASPRRLIKPCTLAVLCCFADAALALPNGAVVTQGSATLQQNGNTLTITNSNGAAINWQGFSIGQNETVRFLQSSTTSAVLNRVVGSDPSRLFGLLQSNGRVWLINPAGILVGPGARIDVAGFVASTLPVRDEDFLAGRLRFTGSAGAAAVSNQGQISTPYGGHIYLVGGTVDNSGTLQAPGGSVGLAAGSSVAIGDTSLPGITVEAGSGNAVGNSGQILSDAGRIGLAGALVKHSGLIDASSAVRQGGRVFLLGKQVALLDGARIDTSGVSGGGTVLVGGAAHGADPTVPNASATYFGSGASINADATQQGSGGQVVIWADGNTHAYGSISARGGANGGDGGNVEVSGKQWLDFRPGGIDTRAPYGRTGSILLDPADVAIVSGSGLATPSSASPDTLFSAGIGTSLIGWDTINTALGSTNVYISTDGSGALNAGRILLANSNSYNSPHSLNLFANGDIVANGVTVANSGTGAINFTAGWNGTWSGTPGSSAPNNSLNSGNIGSILIENSTISSGGAMAWQAGNSIQILGGQGVGLAASVSAGGALSFSAPAITIHGGDGGSNNYASVISQGNQTISAGALSILGGGSSGAYANDYSLLQARGSGSNQQVNISAGGSLTLSSGSGTGLANFNSDLSAPFQMSANYAQLRSEGSQTINFASGGAIQPILTLNAGGNGIGNSALISASGSQTVTGVPDITLTGGTGGGSAVVSYQGNSVALSNSAAIGGNTQNIAAHDIYLHGGGDTNTVGGAFILATAAQQIAASRDVYLYGGLSSNGAALAGSNALIAGATTNLAASRDVYLYGGNGSNAAAVIGTSSSGSITQINAGRDIYLYGNTGDSGNGSGASLLGNTLTLNSGGVLKLYNGSGSGAAAGISGGTLNLAVGGDLSLDGTSGSTALVSIGGNTSTVNGTVGGSLTLYGGSNASASINGATVKLTVSGGDAALHGGISSSGGDAAARIAGTQTTLSVTQGSLYLYGGSGGSAEVGGSTPLSGSTTHVRTSGNIFVYDSGQAGTGFSGNNVLVAAAGSIGYSGLASLNPQSGSGRNGSYRLFAVGDITLTDSKVSDNGTGSTSATAGWNSQWQGAPDNFQPQTGTAVDSGTLLIRNSTLSLSGSLNLVAGHAVQVLGGSSASLSTPITQTTGSIVSGSGTSSAVTVGGGLVVTAPHVLIQGGASGRNNYASISSAGNQTINTRDLSILGGGSGNSDSNNYAELALTGAGSTQTVNIAANGSLTVRAGSGSALTQYVDTAGNVLCTGCTSANFARLRSHGAQAINFASGTSTPTLALQGGGAGIGNYAAIRADNGQTISGRPAINLTGGTGGSALQYIQSDGTPANFSNGALLQNTSGSVPQSIHAASLSLNGSGDAGSVGGALILGQTQVIDVSGDATLTGGASSAAPGTPATIDRNSLSMTVGGNLTLTGGNSPVVLGDPSSGAIHVSYGGSYTSSGNVQLAPTQTIAPIPAQTITTQTSSASAQTQATTQQIATTTVTTSTTSAPTTVAESATVTPATSDQSSGSMTISMISSKENSASPAANSASASSGTASPSSASSAAAVEQDTKPAAGSGHIDLAALATMLAQHHQQRTELYQQALEQLRRNPAAADAPDCKEGAPQGTEDVCVRTDTHSKIQLSAHSGTVPETRRRVALLIGNNAYREKGIPQLKTPVADVRAVATVLKSHFNFEVQVLADATKADIFRAMNRLAGSVDRADSVFIMYAGHGYLMDDTNMGFWIPVDAKTNSVDNWISNRDISRFLRAIPARQVMLVSDSCFSGSLTRELRIKSEKTLARNDILRQRSVTALSSGGEEPVADAGSDTGHSVFAGHLLDSLSKLKQGETGFELYQHLYRAITEEMPQSPQYGGVLSAGHSGRSDYLIDVKATRHP